MTGQQPTFDDATSGEVIDCAPDWPELPAGWGQQRWGVMPSGGPTYVLTADFNGSPPPVYGVIVSNSSEPWTYRWGGDSPDSCSPDTTQPYPLDDLIKRIDDVTGS